MRPLHIAHDKKENKRPFNTLTNNVLNDISHHPVIAVKGGSIN